MSGRPLRTPERLEEVKTGCIQLAAKDMNPAGRRCLRAHRDSVRSHFTTGNDPARGRPARPRVPRDFAARAKELCRRMWGLARDHRGVPALLRAELVPVRQSDASPLEWTSPWKEEACQSKSGARSVRYRDVSFTSPLQGVPPTDLGYGAELSRVLGRVYAPVEGGSSEYGARGPLDLPVSLPVVVNMPQWGAKGYSWRATSLARPLAAEHGVATVLLVSAFFGSGGADPRSARQRDS